MPIRLIFAAVLALLPAFIPSAVFACSRADPWTQQTIFEEAKEVFRGRVTKVELSEFVGTAEWAKGRFFVHVYYELKETLKGRPKENGPVSTTIHYFGGCGVPVVVGLDYIFFIDEFPNETPNAWKGNSSGWISIFGSVQLPPSEEKAEEAMAKVRSYGARP